MNIYIENDTAQLNPYFFQTLCVLYFPGEKFPEKGDDSGKNAYFKLKHNGEGFTAYVRLEQDGSCAEAVFETAGYTPRVEMTEADLAGLAVGKAFSESGRRLFGFGLPWGFICGLRPVKRAGFYLDKGYSRDKVLDYFVKDFDVTAERAELALGCAELQQKVFSRLPYNSCSLYVSIPFCPSRCKYCSFISFAGEKLWALIPDYLQMLKKDLQLTAKLIKDFGMELNTVYIGGGTPSVLNERELTEILQCITKEFDFSKVIEFSFEGGRPDTLTKEKLTLIKNFGVNRISINPQTLHNNILNNMGRKHTAEDFYKAAEIGRSVGFDCINADLITGLPGDSQEGFAYSLDKIIELSFENITVHTLSIKNAGELKISQNLTDPRGTMANNCSAHAYKALGEDSYKPYYLYRQKNIVGNGENTGYSLTGKENIYNIVMMEEYTTVLSCGAGGITKTVDREKTHIQRVAAPKYPFEYLTSGVEDKLSKTAKALEESCK